jgi:hypothetical protein
MTISNEKYKIMAMFDVLTDMFGVQHIIELPEGTQEVEVYKLSEPEAKEVFIVLQEVDDDGSGKPVTCIRLINKE